MLFFGSLVLNAQWNPSPTINNPVCMQTNDQKDLRMISDFRGGAIITWIDFRNDQNSPGVSADIFVQRMNSNGTAQWTANGTAVCIDGANQTFPVLATDGKKGAIITWQDWRSGDRDIYAQRIDSSGNILWTLNGVGVAVKNAHQKSPRIAPDGMNGAFIVWEDSINGSWDIYEQHIDANGFAQWAAGGVAVCTSADEQINPKMVVDAAGNSYITWQDKRNSVDYDVYCQKMNSSGVAQWTANGIPVAVTTNTQSNPKIVLDYTGMVIIGWQDKRNNIDYNIYAQRISSLGVVQWASNGVAVCNAVGNQSAIDMTTENITDGAIISWKDGRNANVNIYSQKIDLYGNFPWSIPANGVLISAASRGQINPNSVGDGYGGAIVVWQDSLAGVWNVYSQRISTYGGLLWTAGGVAIGTAVDNQTSPKNIADGNGGCIFAFQDKRNGDFDVYAYKLDYAGVVSSTNEITAENNTSINVYPNPSSGEINFVLQNPDPTNTTWELKIFDMTGSLVFSKEISGTDHYLMNENLDAGSYYFQTINSKGVNRIGRFEIIH